ncbi:MAG: DUF3124 domain-containing protein [Spirochaetes bacterium]|nr:DUF3124 domain-containing protein [Spirochaetota bacterium]
MKRRIIAPALFVLLAACLCGTALSAEKTGVSNGQTVYVPAYSSIYHSDLKWDLDLSITLSIHNIDPVHNIVIESIDYFNTRGTLIHRYLKNNTTMALRPMETYNIAIKEKDDRGGIGANFIVRWKAQSKVNNPIVETIMIGTKGQQGISFTSRGVAISQ